MMEVVGTLRFAHPAAFVPQAQRGALLLLRCTSLSSIKLKKPV
jgi:hypothetical protein